MILKSSGDTKKGKHNIGNKRLITLESVLVFLIIVLAAAVRIRLLPIPLERDEGEFAYMGQLMLNGIPPYKLAYNMKMPGIYAIYALIMAVFGQSSEGIHIGLMLANSVSILLVFLIGRKLFGKTAGIAACLAYAILSISPTFVGFAAHATHFVVMFALAGIYIIVVNDKRLSAVTVVVSGIMLGIAFLMKQPGLLFSVFTLFYIIYRERCAGSRTGIIIKKTGLHLIGIAAPIVITMILLWKAGVWDKFWFWTFDYGTRYASQVKISQIGEIFTQQCRSSWFGVWPLLIVSILGFIKFITNTEAQKHRVFVVTFFIASFLAVCPGFYFRSHYFILMLPAVSILCGMAFSIIEDMPVTKKGLRYALVLPAVLFAGAAIYPYKVFGSLLFTAPPIDISRIVYNGCPFAEAPGVAEYIQGRTGKNDSIAVLGSEPEIYFYSHRRSATGYIYMYPLMEMQPYAHRMQEEMVREIKSAKPAYILFVNTPISWNKMTTSDRTLLTQMIPYIGDHYFMENKALIGDGKFYIVIFKRK